MRHLLKKFWWVLILILLFPLVLNFILVQPCAFHVVGDGSTWLSFWVTYISSIASFAMVLITWLSLKESKKQNKDLIKQNETTLEQNRDQLDELKRQWHEANRPQLVLSIITNNCWYLLKVENVGSIIAKDIYLEFQEDFIASLQYDQIKENLLKLRSPFYIQPHSAKYFNIAPHHLGACTISCGNQCFDNNATNKWLEQHLSDKISISGKYSNIYDIEECFSLEMFSTPSATVNDPIVDYLGWIKNGTVFQNNSHSPIQKSLEEISKSLKALEQYSANNSENEKK